MASAMLALCLGAAGCKAQPVEPPLDASVTHAFPAPAFPLKVASGNRYLEDAQGKPFLIQGDSAWSLIADLKREDVDRYLDDRRARGFNTLLVSLIEHMFSSKAPANIYGDQPFLTPGDFSTPNPKYFDHAHWVLERAREKGFLVLLAPAYVGAGGEAEGWYNEMEENGADKLYAYGRFVGERFSDLPNILFVHAGDWNPDDKALVRAIAQGVRETDPGALNTAHGSVETTPLDFWQGESWLQVNNIYTYNPVHDAAIQQYRRPASMPFFLIESGYENEHGVDARRLRTQAYHALLSGAAGEVFGNNPIWHFDGPGLFKTEFDWRAALDSAGARSMNVARTVFEAAPWTELVPDDGALLVSGEGEAQDRAVAARTPDGRYAMVYLPSSRAAKLDMSGFAGPVSAEWIDPASGEHIAVEGSPFAAEGKHTFRIGARNSSAYDDWLLVLQAKRAAQ